MDRSLSYSKDVSVKYVLLPFLLTLSLPTDSLYDTQTPLERAALVDTSDALDRVHAETASSGQTATPNLEVEVDLHFVTFVNHKGYLVELDGRRPSPVNHGKIEVGLLEVGVDFFLFFFRYILSGELLREVLILLLLFVVYRILSKSLRILLKLLNLFNSI